MKPSETESSADESWRCFIAVSLPAASIEAVSGLQRKLRRQLVDPSIRWTKPDQWHLTIRFLGEVALPMLPTLKEACRQACVGVPPFSLSLQELGSFPPERPPRVFWLGIKGDEAKLHQLHRQVTDATGGLGSHEETKAFEPHLTLARIKAPGRVTRTWSDLLRSYREIRLGEWTVTELLLMRSCLMPQGAEYKALARFPLAPTV